MHRWPWIVIVVACGSDRDDRATKPPAVGPGAVARRSIDVTPVPGAPVTVRGLEVELRPRGELDVTYRVDAKGGAIVPARTMCRVGDRNVVYPMSTSGKVAGPRLSSVFRPAPFSDAASACEIVFFHAPDAQSRLAIAGRACFEAGKLRDGACGGASFPAPQLPTAGAVVLERAAIELHDSSATVTALYTLAQPIGDDRKLAGTIACEDATGKVTGETALTFVPLEDVPVGASVFGPLTFPLERTPAPDAKCSVLIVSRTVGVAPGGERVLAQYCVTAHSVVVGRC